MLDKFEKEIFNHINSFRTNPESIRHQIEILKIGLGRLASKDPFLFEIDDFIESLSKIPKMPPVVINKFLCDIAASEVKKYSKDEDNYGSFKTGKELEGILPENYMKENPALAADNGADYAESIVPKLLLNKLDEKRQGRKIMCTKEYTQVGIAKTKYNDENYYIIIFANNMPKTEGNVTLSVRQKDYSDNYQYYETKFLTNKKYKVYVQHKRHGQIMGEEKGSGDPEIFENQTTMTQKEAENYENVNNAFRILSPQKNGFSSKTYNFRSKKPKKIDDDEQNERIEKFELKTFKVHDENKIEKKREKRFEKFGKWKGKKDENNDEEEEKEKEEKKEEPKKEIKIKKKKKIIEEKEEKHDLIEEFEEKKVIKEEKREENNNIGGIKVNKKLFIEKTEEKEIEPEENTKPADYRSKIKSIRRRFYNRANK